MKSRKFNSLALASFVVLTLASVVPVAAEETTSSGIIIPETAKEKPQKGTVVAVGPGTSDEKMEVKKGDVVLYGKYSGSDLDVDGNDYLIMKQSDILAII